MSKFLLYFSLVMSFVYVLAGIYLISAPYIYKGTTYSPIMPWIGILVVVYGIFRVVRSLKQFKNYVKE